MGLVDILSNLEQHDEEIQKEAEEMDKLAAEEDAAGRIMARGFMDELNKLAADFPPMNVGPKAAELPAKGVGGAVPGARPPSVVNPPKNMGSQAVGNQFKTNAMGKPQGQ